MISFFKKTLILFLILNIFSCKTKEEKITAESMYLKAFEALQDKDYTTASETFEKIDDEFPFTKWSIKGQIMAVYANYRLDEFEKTIQLADDFTKLHPTSEFVPYSLYMKGLSYYNKIPSIERAQDYTRESSLSFRELIAKFPDSEYAIDAREKIIFIDEHLAGAKMSIARYQINSQNYIGAIKNIEEVITRYSTTNQVPEGYYRLIEIYFRIGMKEEALEIIKILQTLYPFNYWSIESSKFIPKTKKSSTLRIFSENAK
jgi:outer membrane protein assembly factor BamD